MAGALLPPTAVSVPGDTSMELLQGCLPWHPQQAGCALRSLPYGCTSVNSLTSALCKGGGCNVFLLPFCFSGCPLGKELWEHETLSLQSTDLGGNPALCSDVLFLFAPWGAFAALWFGPFTQHSRKREITLPRSALSSLGSSFLHCQSFP